MEVFHSSTIYTEEVYTTWVALMMKRDRACE